MKNKEGFVYILSNKSMPGLIKIGCTQRDPQDRATELYATGVPFPFIVEAAVKTNEPKRLESRVHDLLGARRVHGRREFFHVAIDDALRAIEQAAREQGRRVTKPTPRRSGNKQRIQDVPLGSAIVMTAFPVPTLLYMGQWQTGAWLLACLCAVSLGTPPALKTILGMLGRKFGFFHLALIAITIGSMTPEGHNLLLEKFFVLSNLAQSYLHISI